ncbi:2-phospho-L-lactate guanylyltransferase [Arsenicicoccus piscis]|uniref:2-phospho-L-lactate guanylyltransferase n=1 Tax=Arsenicicoccus piscis TaxID=673954 RepID=A0ABQ6HND7_9MICO|nr:2-phospho-L-lactate guanylyltransferase [Arsenicicoccus piscis]
MVPVKATSTGKSRLAPPRGVPRQRLALAMAIDTLAAVGGAVGFDHVVVVTDDEQVRELAEGRGSRVVADPRLGLNDAIRAGAAAVLALPDGSTRAVAAVLGDLPSLRADDLVLALTNAAAHERAYVPDLAGTGTVLLTARAGVELLPRFGRRSAALHREAATPLSGMPIRLRTDVDDQASLLRAIRLGCGPQTRAALNEAHWT